MGPEQVTCIVCNSVCIRQHDTEGLLRYDCARCGVFVLANTAEAILLSNLTEKPIRRSLMSYTLRRMQQRTDNLRVISSDDLPSFWSSGRLPSPREQVDSLILWVGDNQEGASWFAKTTVAAMSAYLGIAISPNGNREGLDWLHSELQEDRLYEFWDDASGNIGFRLTMKGWSKYQDLKTRTVNSRTAFMAMKFGDKILSHAVEKCFRPAVELAGFRLKLLSDEQPAGLIDDQLRAAILSARFLIADLTHGNQGAYWEAGFAEGLGIPVIYTCEAARWKESKTHFDTNHMLTIIWDSADLTKAQHALTATIRATLRAEAKHSD